MDNNYITIFLIICLLIIIFFYFNQTTPNTQKENVKVTIQNPIDKNVIQAVNIAQTTQSSPLLS